MNPAKNLVNLKFCENLNKLRNNQKSCDVIIQIGSELFSAHRFVLIARMDFFARMFSGDKQENKSGIVKFESDIVSPDVFDDILKFVYTYRINFTQKNASKIFVAANFFCYERLLERTQNYIESHFDAESVYDILKMAKAIGVTSLEEKCFEFIYNNSLSEIIKQEYIPYWSFEDLLNVFEEFQNHEEHFNTAVEWVKLDEIERKILLPELLKKIKLTRLSFEFIYKFFFFDGRAWLEKMECLDSIVKIYEEISKIEVLHLFCEWFDGYEYSSQFTSVVQFESSIGTWPETVAPTNKRSVMSCAVVGDKIYLCGGYGDQTYMGILKASNILEVFEKKLKHFEH